MVTGRSKPTKKIGNKSSGNSANGVEDAASLVALTAKDSQLRQLLLQYHSASPASRKKFYEAAKRVLN